MTPILRKLAKARVKIHSSKARLIDDSEARLIGDKTIRLIGNGKAMVMPSMPPFI